MLSVDVTFTLIVSSLSIVVLFLTLFISIVGVDVFSGSLLTCAYDNTVKVYLVVPDEYT